MPFDQAGHYFELGLGRGPSGRPGLFLDRDGVIIEDRHYLKEPDGVHLVPEATTAVRRFRDAGYAIVIVTNQAGIGRGLLDWPDFFAVQARLRSLWAAEDLAWDMVLACPHHPTQGRAPFDQDSPWRKPRPGMIHFAADTLGLDLAASSLVGDQMSDLAAGAAAGIPHLVHVETGKGLGERTELDASPLARETVRIPSLAALRVAARPGT